MYPIEHHHDVSSSCINIKRQVEVSSSCIPVMVQHWIVSYCILPQPSAWGVVFLQPINTMLQWVNACTVHNMFLYWFL